MSDSTTSVDFEEDMFCVWGDGLSKKYTDIFSCSYWRAFNFSVFIGEANRVPPREKKCAFKLLFLTLWLLVVCLIFHFNPFIGTGLHSYILAAV